MVFVFPGIFPDKLVATFPGILVNNDVIPTGM